MIQKPGTMILGRHGVCGGLKIRLISFESGRIHLVFSFSYKNLLGTYNLGWYYVGLVSFCFLVICEDKGKSVKIDELFTHLIDSSAVLAQRSTARDL